MKYPTKEEILSKRPDIKEETIKIILSWKKEFLKDWKNSTNSNRIIMLKALIYSLVIKEHPSLQNPKKEIPQVELGKEYCYDMKKKIIYLEAHNPSIISTLHELGHYLHGKSELKACRWSIWIFMECFPGLYKNLKWKNHMLKK